MDEKNEPYVTVFGVVASVGLLAVVDIAAKALKVGSEARFFARATATHVGLAIGRRFNRKEVGQHTERVLQEQEQKSSLQTTR